MDGVGGGRLGKTSDISLQLSPTGFDIHVRDRERYLM